MNDKKIALVFAEEQDGTIEKVQMIPPDEAEDMFENCTKTTDKLLRRITLLALEYKGDNIFVRAKTKKVGFLKKK